MANLKNNLKLFLATFVLTSCQTKTFQIRSNLEKELNVVSVASDRVIQECYFLNAEKENNWRHQYLLHILNDKNEIITAMHPISLDKNQCEKQMKKIDNIIKRSTKVSLCLRDKLVINKEKSEILEKYDFGHLGKYTSESSPYDYLTFDTICNDKQCYSISDTWTYTCPEFKGNKK